MKKFLSKKVVNVALAFFFTAGTSYVAACDFDCASYASTERNRYCAEVRGGSACASSPGLYNYFYQLCRENNCSN